MNYEIVNVKEKIVAGIAVRTNNSSLDMTNAIGNLWKRFYEEDVYADIPNKISPKVLGVYTDYENNEKGEYTFLTCCAVSEKPMDKRLTVLRIPAGRYAKFTVNGDVNKAVSDVWQAVWKLDLPRSFVCDFEEYQNSDMTNAEINLYIGLKEG